MLVTQKSVLLKSLVFWVNIGMPLSMVFPILLNSNTTPFVVVMRVLIMLISLFLIFSSDFKQLKSIKFSISQLAFFLFWGVYLVRLIFDLYLFPIYIRSENVDVTKILSFTIFMCILPNLAIFINRNNLDLKSINFKFLYWLVLESIVVLFLLLWHFKTNLIMVFANRSMITHGDSIFPLNPIFLSRLGASLILVILLNYSEIKTYGLYKVILYFILGLFLLFIGGSRGPLISLTIVICLILFSRLNSLKVYIYVLIVGILVYLFSSNFQLFELDIFKRILNNDIDSFDRMGHWQSAISQFLNNPFFGDKIFDNYLGSYPHNILLEILMSTGLLGFLLFVLSIKSASIKLFNNIFKVNSNLKSISALCLLNFLFSLSSSSIYYSVEFWNLTGLLLFLPKDYNNV